MTAAKWTEFSRRIAITAVELAIAFLKECDAQEIGSGFTGPFLGNFLLTFSDEDWFEIREKSKEPCGMADCSCHMEKRILFEALDVCRDKAQELRNEMKT